MKITVDIDCTPQEARTFLGLPEVEKMQEAVMKELQAKMLRCLQCGSKVSQDVSNIEPR